VDWAAEWRAGIMEGPGRRWAFVRCAHVAMARGPRVYWDWTVSGVVACQLLHKMSRREGRGLEGDCTANVT
jgi:hypothetical protein